jgi:hypothetical protein
VPDKLGLSIFNNRMTRELFVLKIVQVTEGWRKLQKKELHILFSTQTIIPTQTSCSRVLPEKLTCPLLVKKFPTFYGIRSFITAFTRTCHVSLSWDRSNKYMPTFHILNVHYNIIHPFTPRTSKWPLSLGLPTKTMYAPPISIPHACCLPHLSFSYWFDHMNNIWRRSDFISFLVMYSSPLHRYFLYLKSKYLHQS